jgi:hypothetical protein
LYSSNQSFTNDVLMELEVCGVKAPAGPWQCAFGASNKHISMWQETAALRDFIPAYVGSGSRTAQKPHPRLGPMLPNQKTLAGMPETPLPCHKET